MGIDVLDHVIITKNKVFSFKACPAVPRSQLRCTIGVVSFALLLGRKTKKYNPEIESTKKSQKAAF